MLSSSAKSPGTSILVIEDDKAVSGPISMLLSHYEYEVTVAPTLAEGVKAFKNEPSIIVLDLQLPDGNGLTLLEHIRKTGKSVKVFILTGESRPEVQRQIRRLMPDRCFTKPFNFISILEAIRSATGDRDKEDVPRKLAG